MTQGAGAAVPLEFRSFDWGDIEGSFAGFIDGPEVEREVRRILDPASAVSTIHWGRNYLYESRLETAEGALPVVVKQFRNHGWKRSLERRLKGSKATRSWAVARALIQAGLSTPTPVLLAESTDPQGNSHFVAALLKPSVEVRQFFQRLNGEGDGGDFPDVDPLQFLRRLGGLARSLHEAGIVYRDLSLGNVLAHPGESGEFELFLVDFNRARLNQRPGVWRRSRDICRFPIIDRKHREAYLEGYWGEAPKRWSPKWWIYTASVRGYLLKHQIKNKLRSRSIRGTASRSTRSGVHHAHIPAAAEGSSMRDKSVWDRLSDQPHQHATRWQKTLIRLADAPDHLADFAAVAASAPAVWRRYRHLRDGLWKRPVPMTGFGVAVRPCPDDPDAHFDALRGLGVHTVLLRLHPWEDEHEAELALAQRLNDAGVEVVFSLPQNRDLVTDPERWERSIETIARAFAPFGRHFILGHAVNRSKWGVWTSREHARLLRPAAAMLRADPDAQILGPGVIDFEFQATLSALQRKRPGVPFDAVASLLYVDRRGAPENPQMGLDTLGKATLLKAICESTKFGSPRSWVTEVNWPLWEGPHSPAGRSVSVNEETQANYLVRYYIWTLASGMVERVYWWRLAARGYGLSTFESDGTLRLRPSYHALKTLIAQLDGATAHGPIPSAEGTHVFRFETGDGEILVGWAMEEGTRTTLPAVPRAAFDRDGNEIEPPSTEEIVLGPAPVYLTV